MDELERGRESFGRRMWMSAFKAFSLADEAVSLGAEVAVHRHAGIGLHTPASVHYGTADQVRAQRAVTLDAAYAANPARFHHRRPTPPRLPTVAWINEPTREALIHNE